MAGSIVINRKMRRNCLAVASTRGLQRAPTGHQEINWCACQISNNLLCGLRVMPVPLTLISPQIHYCPFLPFFFFLTSLIHAVRSSRLWVAARGPKLVVLPVSSETHIMHACTLMQNTHTHYNMNSDTGTQAQTSAGAHLFVYLHRSLCSPDSEVKLKVKSSKKKK